METANIHVTNKAAVASPCTHSRMIDDVRTRGKKSGGKVRCLECGAIVDDPYQELK